MTRKKILEIISASKAAHIGTSLSLVEMLDAVFVCVDLPKIKSKDEHRDRIILSKGHGAAALYAVMHKHGLLTDEEIDSYSKNDSLLSGHCSHFVPYVEHSTGALGHGLPVSLGIALGLLSKKSSARVFVIVGDGELQEGSNWEALMLAGHLKTSNLCVLVDNNKLGSIGETDLYCSLEPLQAKLESFNFETYTVDGHNIDHIQETIKKTACSQKPVALICQTIKGKGVSFMEHNNLWHYRTPVSDEYQKAVLEIEGAK